MLGSAVKNVSVRSFRNLIDSSLLKLYRKQQQRFYKVGDHTALLEQDYYNVLGKVFKI